ncbi:MAG: NADH-quinone oxidoreductase subunit N [Coriobacteriia bacterium]|nr:NADH-quinone oxidoreductase subunit N [Coriobacteriia bacterium]
MTGYAALIPEALVLAAALAALFAGLLPGGARTAAGGGAAAAALSAVLAANTGGAGSLLSGTLALDGAAAFVRAAIAALTAAYLMWLAGRGVAGERAGEAAALALLSAGGGMLLASATDLVTFFVAVELATMPAYVLVGYRRDDARGLEGALKYFLLSLLTSLVMLYGLSFLYGVSGSTRYAGLDGGVSGTLGLAGALLVAVGLLAKISAVPFHFWAPDGYAGAPAETVAFVSTVPKVAAMAAAVRLLGLLAPQVPNLPLTLALAAAASMVLGNLAAFPQRDIRRLMAYSGIGHAGYLLMGIVAGTERGAPATLFYAAVFAVPSMAVVLIAAEEGTDVRDLAGLAERRPAAAWAMTAFLLSLIGIPPLAGFVGKLQLFGAALDGAWVWLVVLAVSASAVSAGYYFRLIAPMFLAPAEERPAARAPAPSAPAALALAAMLAVTLAAGVLASPLLRLLGAA